MADRLDQSVAIRIALKAYKLVDHSTDATGKTIPIEISKNGGSFGNPNAGATNATEIAHGWYYMDLDVTDTNTLGPLIIRGTELTIDNVEIAYQVSAPQLSDVKKVNGSSTAASNLSTTLQTIQTGTAVTGTLSTTVFTTDLASTTVDEYKNRVVRFTSGALVGQERVISAYSATGQITVSSAFTTAPSNTDAFVIV